MIPINNNGITSTTSVSNQSPIRILQNNHSSSNFSLQQPNIKNQEGHDPKNFKSTVNKDFFCPICNLVVRKPRECVICGNIFCEYCIKSWADKMNKISFLHVSPNSRQPILDANLNYIITECPMKCKSSYNLKESIFKPVGKVVKNILYQLEIKCPNITCGKEMCLDKYEEHEFYCFLPKCQNVICGKGTDRQIIVSLKIFKQ